MDQYNTSGLVKYQLFGGKVRPVVGALASYVYRVYTDTQFAVTDKSLTSHAMDVGLMTGADIQLTEGFSIGLDFRYMWNLTNRQNDGLQRSFQQPNSNLNGYKSVAVEELNYFNVGITGRASF
jgi:hypothetical protein